MTIFSILSPHSVEFDEIRLVYRLRRFSQFGRFWCTENQINYKSKIGEGVRE